MDVLLEFTKSSEFGIILITVTFINIALLIFNMIKTFSLNKKYNTSLGKLEKGENINEMLRKYIETVESVENENATLKKYCKEIEKNMEKCIQKVGFVRYNAFKNTGSDLCFAVALLDFEDNGIVINGIYSRDNTTTTYAKPVEKGTSKYALAKEEEEAIDIAKHSGYKYYMDVK